MALKKLKIKKGPFEFHFEDIFLDKYSKDKASSEGFASEKLEVPLRRVNFAVLLGLSCLFIIVLVSAVFRLQFIKAENFQFLAQQNKFKIASLKSERGVVYDSQMNQLVWNEASFDLWVDPLKIPVEKKDEIVKEVAWAVGKDVQEIEETIALCPKGGAAVVKNLEHQKLIILESRQEDLPGFFVKKNIIRHYLELESLGHILGYLGKVSSEEFKSDDCYEITDYIGKEGLEKSAEDILREKKGEIKIFRNAKEEEISREIASEPQSGNSLVLNLDLALQQKIEEVLQKIIKEVKAEGGVVIALNPQNGAVLASVSLPGFDNNLFSQGISIEQFQELNQDPLKPQLNRAIGGLYPTGSALKPFIALAALAEGIITPEKQLYCPLKLCVPNQYNPEEAECFSDNAFHGWTDLKRAIAESVNPYFFMLGGGYQAPKTSSPFYDERLPRNQEGLGAKRIENYLKLFGFGTSTQVDLPGELNGRIPTPQWKENYFSTAESRKWYLGDTYNLSIGQGYFLATPLQLASAVSVIANGGALFKPQLIKAVISAENGQTAERPPQLVRENFIKEENINLVRAAMREAVKSPAGSAYILNALPVSAGAKTGTAQTHPSKEVYHNWITVFAPYQNPEIVLVVLAENVEGLQVVAKRIASDILQWYFTR